MTTRLSIWSSAGLSALGALGASLASSVAFAEPPPSPSAATTTAAPAPVAPTLAAERIAFLEGFAASLVRERDYYRAISVWKELRFGSPDPRDRVRYSLAIAHGYRASQRYASALSASPHVIQSETATAAQRAEAELLSGESYLGLKIPFQAEVHLTKGLELAPPCSELSARAELMLGVARSEAGDWERARAYFLRVQQGKTALAQVGTDFAAQAEKAPDMPHRSPFAAALLSAVLPGAGQAYTGHWVDGAQALFFVGAFAFASFLAYSYEHEGGRPLVLTTVSLSITGIFHISNIVGAERTARYYNQHQRDLYAGAIRDRALALP